MTAFADAAHFQMNFQALYDLIDTVEADQHFEMFETDRGLLDYCYGVGNCRRIADPNTSNATVR